MITTVSTSFIKGLLDLEPTLENRRALGRLRRRWKISLSELGDVSGYSQHTLKQYEMADRRSPSKQAMNDWWESLTKIIHEKRQRTALSAETV